MQTYRRDGKRLAGILFFIVFMNGFEAGGYQASLLSIGKGYRLGAVAMGLFASAQLIAQMIAPMIFGPIADRIGKKKVFLPFLAIQTLACILLMVSQSTATFIPGIFTVGLSMGVLQNIAIAELADAFPVTGQRKIGYFTGLYSLGAVIAPALCSFYLKRNVSWKLLFVMMGITSAVNLFVSVRTEFAPMEDAPGEKDQEQAGSGVFVLSGIILLCIMIFVYAGFENGFAFFVNSFISEELQGSNSYLALSFFWLAMIPSRMLCGHFSRFNQQILLISAAGAVLFAFLIGMAQGETAALVLCFPLGFFCGAIYPAVLNASIAFSGTKTASVTGMIAMSIGIGGALISASTGVLSQMNGLRYAMLALAAFLLLDVVISLILMRVRIRKAG